MSKPKGLIIGNMIEAGQESGNKTNMLEGLFSDTVNFGKTDDYQMINVNLLDEFFDHPFRAYSNDEMQELVESIKELGVLQPIIVRLKGNKRYEVLAGHNRTTAARLAGLRTVPCKVVEVEDDKARMIVTSTNLNQREKIYPSDKARAYKMQLDVLKSQGKRTDLVKEIYKENNTDNFGTIGAKVNSRDIVAKMNNTNRMNIGRYIRLLELEEPLLDMVDSERILFRAGVELSYLPVDMQSNIVSLLEEDTKLTVSLKAAELLKINKDEDLSVESIHGILIGKKIEEEPKKNLSFRTAFQSAEKQIKKRVDQSMLERVDEKDLEEVIAAAVEEYLGSIQ